MRAHASASRIGKSITVQTTRSVAAVLALAPCSFCFAQQIGGVAHSAIEVAGSLPEPVGWFGDSELRRSAYGSAARVRPRVFVDEADAGQIEAGAEWAVVQRRKWHATLGIETYELATPAQIDAMRVSVAADGLPGGAVARPVNGAMMSAMPAARLGYLHYTGLRLTGTDVLMRGDSLTLRAGSDLHFLLQGVDFASWAGSAAALGGWKSRTELRWARSTSVGEFSIGCRVDRRAAEFTRAQVQVRWGGRF